MSINQVMTKEHPFVGQYLDKIVFSADQSTLDRIDNLTNQTAMEDFLLDNNIKYRLVEGYYKNNREISFIVNANELSPEKFNLLSLQLNRFNQESILLIGREGNGYLEFIETSQVIPLGQIRVSDEMPDSDGFTYDQLNQVFIYFE